jgi:hypothetical protein
LPGEEREGNSGYFLLHEEERMPPCGPPISKPEKGGRVDVVGEEGFVFEEQKRNKSA